MRDKKKKPKKMSIKLYGLLLGLCIAAGLSIGIVYAEDTDNGKLKNGSFEEEQSWSGSYLSPDQGSVPAWNTTASDGKIELFRKNTNAYIRGVTLTPTDGDIAAELNANEESTLYQNVATIPSSIYEWGLDHGARNGTDTMALVIGPQQTVNPAKPSKNGRDQLMQMVDWLIDQGKTSVKTTAGLGEHLVVYSKKFDNDGTFQNNSGNNAFSLTPSSVYTEEWHVWIIADSRATSGNNPWGSYGSNAEGTAGSTDESGGTDVDMDKYYLYTVPSGQTGTLFGFVSVGYVDSTTSADKAKTYGNFLDNVNFKIFHPLSGSTTLHGSGVVGGSDGTTTGEGSSTGYEVTVDKNLITYAVDGEPLRIQAVVKKDDADAGCEFVGLYYTIQDASGNLVTTFLQKAGNEIDYRDDLTDEEKKDKWIKSTDSNGDIIYTYYLSKITTATDLHFIFIKSPTVTYDPNGGKEYIVDRTYNTNEAKNVYSFKPVVNEGSYTFIPPYRSHAAEGQNDGWKFMGWLLTGDTVDNATIPDGTSQINADKLGTLLLPAEHTIVCDYTVGDVTTKEQYFKIWKDNISLTKNTNNSSYVKWTTDKEAYYANVHKGLTMVAQWRWRQAFIPQLNSAGRYENSNVGGTVEISSVRDKSDTNYNGEYNACGGKSYHAATDEIVTATATANEGYEFVGWYDEGGKLLTTKTTYSFTAIKEKVSTYYARFEKTVTQTYIRQVKDGNTWSVIEGDQNSSVGNLDRYTYTDVVGKQISATAAAGEGYKFIGWYDSAGNSVAAEMLSADKATLRYTTTGEATYYARFEKTVTQKFVRQVKNGDGWTNTSDDSIATLNPYTHTDVVGATANSNATVGEGYKFVGWYDAEGEPVADVMLNADKTTIRYTTTGDATYYARFEKTVTQKFVRQVKNGDGWTNTSDDSIATLNPYTHTDVVGATASSKATVGEGYKFVGWYDAEGEPVADGMLNADKTTIRYTTTGDATYYARFEKTVTQKFVRQVKNGDGWTNTSDDSIATLNPYTHTDVVGATASSKATVGEGYKFVGWYDAEGEPVADGMLNADKTTIRYTTTGDATYYARFEKTVTQTFIRQVKNGDNWEETTDDSIGTLNSYTHTDVVGARASSTATAGEGYEFVGWCDGEGNPVGAEKLSDDRRTISYVTTGNATYYARFRRTASEENVTQTFVRQVEDGESWEETTDDSIGTLNSYTHTDVVGATASSTATAGEGYEFVGWYDVAGNQVGAGSLSDDGRTISYVTTGDATYYARFRRTASEKNVTQTFVRQVEDGESWEETTDDSIGTLNSYTHTDVVGATASSTATAGEGYEFVGWYDVAGNQVGAGSLSDDGRTISYVTTGDATYYARFRRTASEENVTQTFVRQVEVGESWEETTDDSIGTLNSYTHTDVVGATASSTATAGEGYEFVGWYDVAGNQVGAGSLSDDGRTISYVTTGDATYYARFRRTASEENVTQTFVRQVEVGESWEETTDDSIGTLNSYTHTDVVGATASSTATAGEGYEFVGWYDVAGNQVGAGSLSDDGRTISYVTTGDATYYARFRRTASEKNVTQTFVRQVEDGETWEETTDDNIGTLNSYTHTDVVGATASSTATAGTGYKFEGWYDEEGNPVGEDKLSDEGRTLSYATTGNATYYARFKKSASEENLTQTNNPKIEDEETEDDTISVENMIQTKVNQVKNGETLKDASKDISKDTSNDTPQTGDDSNPALWLMLMLLSMSALEGLFIRKKKDRK